MHLLLSFDFFKIIFFKKKNVSGIVSECNSVDPDQDGHPVDPDLGPTCLQKLSAADKSLC